MQMEELRRQFEEKLQSGSLKIIGSSKPLSGGRGAAIAPARAAAVKTANQKQPSTDQRPDLVALTNAAAVWAQASTNADLDRARDIRRDKLRAVREFFAFLDKDLFDVTPLDVQAWQCWLEERGLKATSVYNACAHLSSFFEWIRRQPELGKFLPFNPVRPAFPKCPAPYQSAGTRSLDDCSLQNLWRVMEEARRSLSIIGARDYAIFLFFAASGDRRSEIANLRGTDITLLAGGLIYYPRVKGGNRIGKTIDDADVTEALRDYIKRSGRTLGEVIGRDVPVWLAHDRAREARSGTRKRRALAAETPETALLKSKPELPKGLTSHAFARRMKIYAGKAGIYNFHLHRLRHTFARVVSEDTGSLSAAQEALGHKNQKTTRVYVASVGIRADAHSSRLKNRIRPPA